ncbi:MAG: hypothetical protein AAF628_05015 [Planctomycetota bacterium]
MKAHIVRLEGVEQPCVLLAPHGELPEELVVDFGDVEASERPLQPGPCTYRLEPSSSHDARPVFRMLFDE